jgi:fucose 4-O-acetylase-like acetyltransferase
MDFAKGFVIAAIVMIHVIMLRGDGGPRGHEMISNPVTSALYLGLMLFFIVSGYFYKPGRTPLENIKHRLPPMFIAFAVSLVVLPILMYLYLTAIGCNPDPAGILNSFKVIIGPVTVGEPHGTEFVHYEVYCFAGSYYINVLMG